MKRWGTIISVLLLCLVLAGATACGGGDAGETTQQLAKVVRGDLTVSVSGSGTIETSRQVRLAFGSAGTVDRIYVEEGEPATKGQILAKLDTTLLEQAVRTAEQAVTTARQAVKTAEQSVTAAELTVAATEQSVTAAELMEETASLAVRAAEIDLELANNSYQQLITPYPYLTFSFALPDSLAAVRVAQQQIKDARAELEKASKGEPYTISEVANFLKQAQENLTEAENKLAYGLGEGTQPSSISYWTLRATQLAADKAQIGLDKAQNDLANAGNNVAIARNNLANTRNNLDIARTNLESTKNNQAMTENELDRVSDELEKATILATFDGVVASIGAKEGDTIASPTMSPKTIIHLVDASAMELMVELDEIDIPEVKLGQEAVISIDALPDTEFQGKVTSIYPLPTTVGGVVLYNAKISLDVPGDSGIKVGMSASADIIIDKQSDALLVPVRAVTQDSQGNPVVKVTVNGQTQEKAVVVGISDGLQTEIVSGLAEGETVVIELRSKPEPAGGMFGF